MGLRTPIKETDAVFVGATDLATGPVLPLKLIRVDDRHDNQLRELPSQ
jgi:hypothetical protein